MNRSAKSMKSEEVNLGEVIMTGPAPAPYPNTLNWIVLVKYQFSCLFVLCIFTSFKFFGIDGLWRFELATTVISLTRRGILVLKRMNRFWFWSFLLLSHYLKSAYKNVKYVILIQTTPATRRLTLKLIGATVPCQ